MQEDVPEIKLLYFTSSSCSVCPVLKPKIKKLLDEKFPAVTFQSVDVNDYPAEAAQHSVFTLPVLLIMLDRREQYRFVRNFSTFEVEEKLNRIFELLG
jgi:thioredoxin 1